MGTTAERLAKKPTKEILAIADEVQEVANASQSFAYRFEDMEDGSRLEIRCAPVPRLSGVPEAVSAAHDGALAIVDGQPVTVYTRARVDGTAAQIADHITVLEGALSRVESVEERVEIDAALAEVNRAAEALAANVAGAVVDADSHIAVPADAKTAAYLEELGPGGRAFIAH